MVRAWVTYSDDGVRYFDYGVRGQILWSWGGAVDPPSVLRRHKLHIRSVGLTT